MLAGSGVMRLFVPAIGCWALFIIAHSRAGDRRTYILSSLDKEISAYRLLFIQKEKVRIYLVNIRDRWVNNCFINYLNNTLLLTYYNGIIT